MLNRTGSLRLAALAFAVLALPLTVPLDAHADGNRRALFPDTIALPNGFQPEGIAVGGATIFAGSINTGAIYAASLITGRGRILVPAQTGRAAIGLSYDARTDLIYVAGGPTGQAYVYDGRTGATVATYQLSTTTPTFINDQIVTDDAVYFTDSMRAVFYKVSLSRRARPLPGFDEIALGGEFQQVAGFNSNGIVATPRGDLIIVHSALGLLYRVDPDSGEATEIDVGGVALTSGDGLELRGDDLVVVRNQLNELAIVDFDRRFTRGEVVEVITDDRFDIPTTVASFLGVRYVVNARFGTPPTPETTYTIEKVTN